MKKKIVAILMALYLVTGCSSGGGTAGGAGGGGTTGTDVGLLLSAFLVSAIFSTDTVFNLCFDDMGMPAGEEPGDQTTLGTFTVTYQDVVDTTGGLFPVGLTLESYTVSFVAQGDAGAPGLIPRTFGQTVSIIGPSGTADISVVLMDVGFTFKEYQAKNPGGVVYTYRVTVTYKGRTLAGNAIQVVASTTMELGNFDRCDE